MKGKNNIAVLGVYPSSYDAECGAADLISAGFAARDISVLLADSQNDAGTLGGALGILSGVGALSISGLGPLTAAGPLLTGLAGLDSSVGTGGLAVALVALGAPANEAKRYEACLKDGGTVVSVHCGNAAGIKRAKQVLNSSGAENVAASYDESRSRKFELAVI